MRYDAPYGHVVKITKQVRILWLIIAILLCGVLAIAWPSPWVIIVMAAVVLFTLWVSSHDLRRWRTFKRDAPKISEQLADIYWALINRGSDGTLRIISHDDTLVIIRLQEYAVSVLFWSPDRAFVLRYYEGAQYVWPVIVGAPHSRGELLDTLRANLLARWDPKAKGKPIVPDLTRLLATLHEGEELTYKRLDPSPLPTGPEVTA